MLVLVRRATVIRTSDILPSCTGHISSEAIDVDLYPYDWLHGSIQCASEEVNDISVNVC